MPEITAESRKRWWQHRWLVPVWVVLSPVLVPVFGLYLVYVVGKLAWYAGFGAWESARWWQTHVRELVRRGRVVKWSELSTREPLAGSFIVEWKWLGSDRAMVWWVEGSLADAARVEGVVLPTESFPRELNEDTLAQYRAAAEWCAYRYFDPEHGTGFLVIGGPWRKRGTQARQAIRRLQEAGVRAELMDVSGWAREILKELPRTASQ